MPTAQSTEFLLFPEPVVSSIPDRGRTNMVLAIFVLLCSCIIALVVIMTNGNVFAGGALVATLTAVLVTLYRLDLGFFLFVGAVLTFDQFYIPGFDPLTFKTGYFRNLKEIPYLPSFSAGVVNPLELHLLMLILAWFFVLGIRKELHPRVSPAWGAAVLFFFGMICSFIYGIQRGGDLLVALWEVRALFYLGIMFFFVPQIIQTKEQIHALFWVCIAAISFKAFQGVLRFALLGFSSRGIATLTNHEDPLFILSLVMFLFGLAMFNARDRQRTALIVLLLPLLLGFFVAQRRAVYAAIVPSFAIFIVLLSMKDRISFFKAILPVAGLLAIYVGVFWNSESRWGSPVRLVKSGLGTDPETAGERYYSNLYREFEKIDLASTVQKAPILGIGYGNKYEMPVPLVKIDFPLRDYIPHNQILWVMAKTGALGFFLLWLFLDGFAMRAASLFTDLADPYLKSVLACILMTVGAQMVVSYYDMQLTYYRNMVYLGVLMGLVPAIESVHNQKSRKSSRAGQTISPWST